MVLRVGECFNTVEALSIVASALRLTHVAIVPEGPVAERHFGRYRMVTRPTAPAARLEANSTTATAWLSVK